MLRWNPTKTTPEIIEMPEGFEPLESQKKGGRGAGKDAGPPDRLMLRAMKQQENHPKQQMLNGNCIYRPRKKLLMTLPSWKS